jgi:predicted dehydrogenase
LTKRSVKIHGAGSIGTHLAHASRRLGWDVTVCDIDERALARMHDDLYPQRYGSWDPAIRLFHSKDVPRGGFDVIFVGTPPDVHVPLAIEALAEQPLAVIIEKPLCAPGLDRMFELQARARSGRSAVFIGYDHVVGRAARRASALMADGAVGEIETIDVEFREHWEGIFGAHHWLRGPADTYLGHWRRGGGASGEHSHAINLWQHFARVSGKGRVREVSATMQYRTVNGAEHDTLCIATLTTEGGLVGRVVQDVITRPATKRATIQGVAGRIEWVCGHSAEGDAVVLRRPGRADEVEIIRKTRPDDFIEELRYIDAALDGAPGEDLALDRGIDTMLVVAAAHASHRDRRALLLDAAVPVSLP